MKTHRIHLIRHGLTQANIDGLYVGHTDVSLCEQGRAQLIDMKERYRYPEPGVILSSPLKRCLETAEIIFDGRKAALAPDLIEYNFGSFENRGAEELHEQEPLFDRWLAGEKGVAPPFGESEVEFSKRVCLGFAKIVDAVIRTGEEDVCIITHGGVIDLIMATFALPQATPNDWLTPSGCGYTLRIHPELWMSSRKLEAVEQLPLTSEQQEMYYDGWDYYPEPDEEEEATW